ncbi:MAG: Npt1/Npt2 family nucleotide transporter [Rudaea sp.]
MATLFALAQGAQGLGANGADGLFLIRFGAEFLPYMFMALGVASLLFTLVYSAGIIRIRPLVFLTAVFLTFIAVVGAQRLAFGLGFSAIYPILWLSINVINALLGIITWYVAGEVADTRQAKRLFPLFASGGILGAIVGNLGTGFLATTFGTENVIVVYVLLLAGAWLVTIDIIRRHFHEAKHKRKRGTLGDLRAGFDYVRRSKLMRLMAAASVLFSILFFSVSFPFSREASHVIPDEAELVGFLGLFSGAATVVTLLISLVIANRLYLRFGLVTAILVLPLVYFGGFILWAFHFSIETALAVRLAQLAVVNGIMSPAWWAIFYVVPSDHRGQVFGFDDDLPSQIGVVLSGVLLILGERLLTNSQIFALGTAVALLSAVVVWRMRPAYAETLVHALRAGRFEVFGRGPQSFAPFQGNPGALQVVVKALHDPRPGTRRIAAEVLGRMGDASAAPDLEKAAADEDAHVRRAAVHALGELAVEGAAHVVTARLSDTDPGVRAEASRVFPILKPVPEPHERRKLEELLGDGETHVAVQAAVALAGLGDVDRPVNHLKHLLESDRHESRALAVGGLSRIAAQADKHSTPLRGGLLESVAGSTRDPVPAVRRAAVEALRVFPGQAPIGHWVGALDDEDASVRQAAAQALKNHPDSAEHVLPILAHGSERHREAALDALPSGDAKIVHVLGEYARREAEQARRWHELARAIPNRGRVTRLLCELARERASRAEVRLVKAIGLLSNPEVMELVAKSFKSRSGENRAEAIEALDTLGDKRLARELVPLLEESTNPGSAGGMAAAEALSALLADPDPWARALAARAVAETREQSLVPELKEIAASDGDPLSQHAASTALAEIGEESPMETLQVVSPLERMMLLREVTLFADLSPDDLKQIAEVAREHWYPDGTRLMKEGEEGNELYVLAQGRVRVTRNVNGEEKVIATRSVGDAIGEMAILESAPRFASIWAEGEVRALVLEEDAFRAILRDRPEVSLAVLRALSRRLRERDT